MTKIDWLLLTIGDYIEPIQVQKTLFKFAKESSVPKAEQYRFVAYNWGPCAKAIYPDLGDLRAQGLIEAIPTGQGWSAYRLSQIGEERVAQLRRAAPSHLVKALAEKRKWVTRLPFRQLLKEVYSEYPDYAKRSLFEV